MKIAIHLDGPIIRGNEKQVITLVAGFVRRGHQVVVSCRAGSPVQDALHAAGARTTGIRPRGEFDLWSALRYARWLKRERPDAALLTSWVRDFTSVWTARAAGIPRVMLRVGGVHRLGGWRNWKHRYALRTVDVVLANSRVVAEHLQQGVPDLADVVIVPNGIELDRAVAPTAAAMPATVPGAVRIVAVGGLDWRKGYDRLLEALALLKDQDCQLVIAGEGAERADLSGRAEQLGVAERVQLLGHRSDVPALLAWANVFVLPSRSGEGMPVVLLEALLAARPIVATEVGGAWETLAARDGRTAAGWIVPPDDAAALADALREVICDLRADGSETAQRVAEAQWRVRNWFTAERMVAAVEAALAGPG
jgi:glycosyltransferase involved in cell wall biosynthesis